MNPKTLRGQFNIAQQQMRKSDEYKRASIFEKRAMDRALENQLKQAQKEEKQRKIAIFEEQKAQKKQEEAARLAQKIQSGDVGRQTIYKSGATSFPKDRPYSPEQNVSQLLGSRGYRQAGIESQRRMAQNLAMGLPMGANPSRFESIKGTGISPSGKPVYSGYRFIPSGFGGGWGGIGGGREPKSTGKIKQGPELGAAGSSGYDLYNKMMAEKAGGPQPVRSFLPFTGFGERLREEEATTGGIRGAFGGLTGFGGVPMFPFAGQY